MVGTTPLAGAPIGGLPTTPTTSSGVGTVAPVVPVVVGSQPYFLGLLKNLMPQRWFPVTGASDTVSATPVLDAVLSGPATILTSLYGLLAYVQLQTRISTASDQFLDIISLDYFGNNLPRRQTESDTAFRKRIKKELFRPRATRAAVSAVISDLTGNVPAIFEPANPHDTGGYNSGGLAYGMAGGYGSLKLPFQSFIKVSRSSNNSGVASVEGYITSAGSTTQPSGLFVALRTGVATYIGPDNYMHYSTNSSPRLDYNTGSMVLLQEATATNLYGDSVTMAGLTPTGDNTVVIGVPTWVVTATWVGGTATYTTAAHGFHVGTTLNITVGGVSLGGYNGTFSCLITSSTTFTTYISTPLAAATGGQYEITPLATGVLVATLTRGTTGSTSMGTFTASVPATINTLYVMSIWLYVPTGTTITNLQLTGGTGTVFVSENAINHYLTGAWQRYSTVINSSATTAPIAATISLTASAGAVVYVTAPQIETTVAPTGGGFGFIPTNAMPTSYIPTSNTTPVTRPAETIVATGGSYVTTLAVSTSHIVQNGTMIRSVGGGHARIDYTSGFPQLLNEAAATNYYLNSSTAAGSAFIGGAGNTQTISSAVPALLSAANVWAFTFGAALNTNLAQINLVGSVAGNTAYTWSFWVWLPTGVTAGNLMCRVESGGWQYNSAVIAPIYNAWQRVSVTDVSPSGGGGGATLVIRDLSCFVGETIYVTCPQIEQGVTATSYYPTTGTAATRPAETVSVTATTYVGGYGRGGIEYVTPLQLSGQIPDSSIYAMIAQTIPAGSIAWTQISG